MGINFTEDMLEEAAVEILQELGYDYAFGPDISYGGDYSERGDFHTVILKERVKDALFRLNDDVPYMAVEEAFRQLKTFNSPLLEENNRCFHKLLIDGIPISYKDGDVIRNRNIFVVDFEHPERNNFLAVNQFTIVEHEERRPDIVLFVNGLPLIVMELKSASDENVGIEQAWNQIQTYKHDIPSLFNYNEFCILSDGINAKAGTITSNLERFMNWRSVDGEQVEALTKPQYETLFNGMLSKERLLNIIHNFILFQESSVDERDDSGKKLGDKKTIIKILAAYHQYFAVKKAVEKTRDATAEKGDRKIGVIWHTQGSGKSFSMVFYTAALVREFNNPTIVVITDRNDLDDQLFKTFSKSRDILRQTPKQADVRKLTQQQKQQQLGENARILNGLYDLLNERESGGIIFTTIQKFSPESGEMPVLTDRKNVIIIADEAHRSQYGLDAKTNLKTGDVKFGYAKHLRDALPNASFIGFTGTPIDLHDRSTVAVFGDCIDTYDMTRAVEDKATVKIFYENRIIKLDTNEPEFEKIDDEFEEIMVGQEEFEREKNKNKWARLEAVVGSPNRVKKLAEDIVSHYEEKSKAVDGKAMIVCMSRRICADLYDEIVKLRPDWHDEDMDKGKIKVIMTGTAADNERLQKHTGGKQRRDTLAKRMKDNSDDLKIVIVRDMWLTGFDVPSMHTMYIDKPMKGHNLMQAIARVNRVFKDKAGGVVVDYIGIFESLKSALNQYTKTDRSNTGVDTSQAVSLMIEKLEILRGMMHGLDYSDYFSGTSAQRLRTITAGMDFVLGKTEQMQKEFKKTAVELGKAHSLCAATDMGKLKALEVSYFKAVKASLTKLQERDVILNSKALMEQKLKQMLQRSIISEDIVDVFEALGIKQPDVNILSEEFLNEVKLMKHKNLAVEMLKKLLDGKIKHMERKNLVKSEKYSEMLKNALTRYRNQAITNAEVIEEIVKMAQEIKADEMAQQKLGLNEDEVAFYDALTKENIVKELMNDTVLKTIAQELTSAIRRNVTIDWSQRKSARANMRKIIKRLLRKYDYPPKQAKQALEHVMLQAELMCEEVVEEGIVEQVAEDKGTYTR
jgi:type I restriction enzyme R subunit